MKKRDLNNARYPYDAACQSFPYLHFTGMLILISERCHLRCIFATMKILMVCLGNICRSPLAEGILQYKVQEAGLDWTVESAGTNGYHIGEAPHHLSQKVAMQHGIDISCQRARRFTAADFQQYDMIYALAGDVLQEIKRIAGKHFDASKVQLLMDAVHPGKQMDVPDPWYGPEPGYHEVFDLIDEACDQIIQQFAPIQRNQ
jgi:protein-tyrosine phosphatase